MIYCSRGDLDKYLGLYPSLDALIRFLLARDLNALPAGRSEVTGDGSAYINRFDYETIPEEQGVFEWHFRFADVHIVLSGEETLLVSDASLLTATERRDENDYALGHGPCHVRCRLTPDHVLIVFPREAHMVKIAVGKPDAVRKAVGKFLCGENEDGARPRAPQKP